MKKELFTLLPLLSLLFCIACTRDVELKIETVSPVLVLNASITPDREVAAFLSKSWFLMDSVPEYNLPETGVKIDVYVNDTFRGTMSRSDNPADSSEYKGQFKLPGCYVQTGDKVRLEADAPGFDPGRGETLIPSQTEIALLDTARMITSGSLLFRIYLTFEDKPFDRNYYRLVVERLIEYRKGDQVKWVSSFCDSREESHQLSGDQFEVPSPWGIFSLSYDDPVFQPGIPSSGINDGTYCRGVFSDDMFNGKEYTVTSSFYPVNSLETDSVTAIVHYDVHLLSISESYYNYLKVIRNFSISLGDAYVDGLLEPSETYSNVIDGFGIVTGYRISTRRITMPFGSFSYEWSNSYYPFE